MAADTMVIVERIFPQDPEELFDAWTKPDEMSQWRGSPGTHVEDARADLRTGGKQYHVKVLDDDPTNRVVTHSVFTEFFRPDVFVELQRISGDPEIDPNVTMSQRVEFVKTGRMEPWSELSRDHMKPLLPNGTLMAGKRNSHA